MHVDCPHGWRHRMRVGALTIEDSRVEIHGGLCEAPDLCGIRTCEFFDDSPGATRRFIQAQRRACTVEGLLAGIKDEAEHTRRVAAGDTFLKTDPPPPSNLVSIRRRRPR